MADGEHVSGADPNAVVLRQGEQHHLLTLPTAALADELEAIGSG